MIRLLSVDFKMKNQRGTLSSYLSLQNFREGEKMLCKLVKDYFMCEEAFKLRQCQNWFAKFHC